MVFAGLGQALCYIQHGLDKVYLLIGCFAVPENYVHLIDTAKSKITEISKIIDEHLNVRWLGIIWVQQGEKYTSELKNAEQKFYMGWSEDIKHKKDCLLREEFSYGKLWLKNMQQKYRGNI